MKRIGIIGLASAREWRGVVRFPDNGNFASWIAGRWAPPQEIRRRGVRRDFRVSRPASPWLSLSVAMLQGGQVHMSSNFNVAPSNVRSTSVSRAWHYLSTQYRADASVSWTSLVQALVERVPTAANTGTSHPNLRHRNSVTIRLDGRTIMPRLPVVMSVARAQQVTFASREIDRTTQYTGTHHHRHMSFPGSAERRTLQWNTVVNHLLGGFAWLGGTLNTVSRHHLLRMQENGWNYTALRLWYGAVETIRRHVRNEHGVLSLVRRTLEQHTETDSRRRIELLFPSASASRSRPEMHFPQTAAAPQPEMVQAIRNLEGAVAKLPSLATPAPAPPDIQAITAQVYGQLERQIKIERERRGR